VRCGGRQEKVALDDVLTVDKLEDEEAGSSVTFPALLVVDDGTVISDPAELTAYKVTAEVVGPAKGPKINMIHYRNKTGYKRRQGHRQKYTEIRITGIEKASKARTSRAKASSKASASKATASSATEPTATEPKASEA